MDLTLHVWRQKDAASKGRFVTYHAKQVSPDMSFLEMLDELNEGLMGEGKEPIAFDHDCREGICGSCDLMVNGEAHGPSPGATVCQLHMRSFKDGEEIYIEPWRAKPFPIIKDLIVDRDAFDRIIQAGGFIGAPTGSSPEANALPIGKDVIDQAMDAAACIGCGACVAACPNGSAMLFMGAKVAHLSLLPQGQPERNRRVLNMVARHDSEGFGNCTNFAECEAACPKEISINVIARMNRDLLRASLTKGEDGPERGGAG
ncbi:MAG: succinate dehydrogenase/fumarate reductase iron-sulfur subunit [Chloroflexales bacterium]|nr:succinate dehydrogenase/fumarate reductase iron-sulfur subunit [Chloroflexales bacterium]